MNLKDRVDALSRRVMGDGDPLQRVMATMSTQELQDLIEAIKADRARRGEDDQAPASILEEPTDRKQLADWLEEALRGHRAGKAAGVVA